MRKYHHARLSALLMAFIVGVVLAHPANQAGVLAAEHAQITSTPRPVDGTAPATSAATVAATVAATASATADDPNAAIEVALTDEFSADLIAAISIGTGGVQPSLYCAVQLQDGEVLNRDFQQEFDQTPEFRLQVGSICSDRQILVGDVYAIAPNGDNWSPVLFTQKNGDQTIYAAGLPQFAVLNPGVWLLGYRPQGAEVRIVIPPITGPFFFRGVRQTGIVGGFRPGEQVRAFTYTSALNADGDRVWNFARGFTFSVNASGYRVITVPDLPLRTLVLIGNRRSFVIQNALFESNGNRTNDPVAQAQFYDRVWAAGPVAGGATRTVPTLAGPAASPMLAAGTERTDGRGITQVYVPAGCYTMGNDSLRDITGQIKGQSARAVCLTQPFWIDKFEVDNASWAQYVAEVGGGAVAVDFASSTQPDQPRVGMMRAQAEGYAAWRGGRLPTEAEWEYAARGPNGPLYPWGNLFGGQANVVGVAGKTVSVTSYPNGASWVGALNMAGNVGEWVADCYSAAFDAQNVRNDPVGPCDGSTELVKGSSFAFNRIPAQAAYRFVNPAGRYWLDVGLRVLTPAR
jgi:formylglycine-generating enzyme required for sulfatase activity